MLKHFFSLIQQIIYSIYSTPGLFPGSIC